MIERYTRVPMARIWAPENRFEKWLDVEIAACEAWAALGEIPADAVAEIRQRRFAVDAAFVRRVHDIEETTRHDVIAFTTAVAERMGAPAKYIHYGLTSTDVVDTALALLIKEAVELVQHGADRLIAALRRRAVEWKDTVCMGRTHGVHAEPTTFGLRLALWHAEMERNRVRLERGREAIAVGKISGAVGTYANVDPRIEEHVCRTLGLTPSPISTQVLQRDRHAELMTTLAVLGGTLDKIALQIRLLQQTEVREVEEPFSPGQKGSSAMPHKRNPVTCEQICGLARVLRGNAMAELENQALWYERDISHSSVERVVLTDSLILSDYMLNKMTWVIENMHVYPEQMKVNLERTGGLIFSQRVLLSLVDRGLSREEAYAAVQGNAMRAWQEGTPFRRLVAEDPTVRAHLSEAELAACFDYGHHLQHVDTIFRRLGLM